MWNLGSKMGNLTAQGVSALANLPPQHYMAFLILYKIELFDQGLEIWKYIFPILHPKELSLHGRFYRIHRRIGPSCSSNIFELLNSSEHLRSNSNQLWECAELSRIPSWFNSCMTISRYKTMRLGSLQLHSVYILLACAPQNSEVEVRSTCSQSGNCLHSMLADN